MRVELGKKEYTKYTTEENLRTWAHVPYDIFTRSSATSSSSFLACLDYCFSDDSVILMLILHFLRGFEAKPDLQQAQGKTLQIPPL